VQGKFRGIVEGNFSARLFRGNKKILVSCP
jgi:hypothetical protein